MQSMSRGTVFAAAALGVALVSAIGAALAGTGAQSAVTGMPHTAAEAAGTPQSASSTTGKTAGEAFKNIQVLKDIPQEQLLPTMQFIASSLGVDCEFCHVQGANEKDDKQTKLTARKMMAMTLEINKAHFDNRLQVSCYSCHRGAHEPVGVPVISDVAMPLTEPAPPPPNLTADQLIDKFVAASGGAEALQRITTRVEKGDLLFQGRSTPIEVYAKAPDKRISIMHAPNGDSITAFDGTSGWLANGNRPPNDMPASSLAAAKMDAIFRLPTDLKQNFTRLRVTRTDKIGDQQVYVLTGTASDQTPVHFYFDEQTGLLARVERYQQTALGRNPTQIDYADYREVDGVKIPYRWTLARPAARFTIQIDQVQQNVPLDDAKFAKPAAAGQGSNLQ